MMQGYTEYKDSGVDWLGEVPAVWLEKPVFAMAELKSVTGCADRELLSIYLDQGVIRFSDVKEKRTNVTSLDLSNYQAVDDGDFVLNNQQAWRGSVGVSRYSGIVSPAYIVLKLSNSLDTRFANYLFRDGNMVAHYLVSSKGVGTIQRNLYWPKLKRAPLFIPPLSEQSAIAEFLDDKIAKIDELVKIKRRQIELLAERKQILIQNAVTKGLNPNAPMKDSCLDWLGKVPTGWYLQRNKFIFEEKTKVVGKNAKKFKLLSLTLGGVIPRNMENPKGKFPAEFNTYKQVSENDLVFCLFDIEETPRAVGIAGESGMITGAYTVLKTNPDTNPSFVNYFYLSLDDEKQLKSLYTGLRNVIKINTFMSMKTPFPDIDIQTAIVKFLDDKTANINNAINIKQNQITKLNEYKSTLINAAVTGKIKVT